MKKCFSVFLVFIISITMLFGASADTQYTIQTKVGEQFVATGSVNELLEVMKVKLSYNDNAFDLTLNISDTDVTSLLVRSDVDGIYVSNDILAEQPLYFSFDDLAKIITQSAQNNANRFSIDSSSFEKMIAEDESLLSFVQNVMSKVNIESGNYSFDDADSAVSYASVKLESNDFVALFESETITEMINAIAAVNAKQQNIDPAEIEKEINDKKAKFLEDLKTGKANIQCEVNAYADENNLVKLVVQNNIVYDDENNSANINFNKKTGEDNSVDYFIDLKLTEDDEPEVDAKIQYNSKVIDHERNDALNAIVQNDDQEKVEFTGTYHNAETNDGKYCEANSTIQPNEGNPVLFAYTKEANENMTKKYLTALIDNTQFSLISDTAKKETGFDKNLQFYMRENAAALISPAPSDIPALEVFINKEEVSESKLGILDSITKENCLQPLTMSDEELSDWTSGIMQRAMSKLFSCISLLPTSALGLFMQ